MTTNTEGDYPLSFREKLIQAATVGLIENGDVPTGMKQGLIFPIPVIRDERVEIHPVVESVLDSVLPLVLKREEWATPTLEAETFEEWVAYGLAQGWVGPAVCSTHDGIPTTAEEDEEFEEGDPCVHVLRLYADQDVRKAVEDNHSPSVWRKP